MLILSPFFTGGNLKCYGIFYGVFLMELGNRLCQVCQKEFLKTRFWSKYCSLKCRRKGADGRWRSKNKRHLKKYYHDYYLIPKNRAKRIKTGRKHYWNNRDKKLEQAKNLRQRRRKIVIEKYGGFCACCGEKSIEFLAIDHINGGGYKEITSLGSQKYFQRLFKRKPDRSKYRVLCHNCNSSKGFYGYCPHENN